MKPDEKDGVVPPVEDIIEVAEGQTDPLDSITDLEEMRKQAKANRSMASRYKKRGSQPAPAVPPTQLPTPPAHKIEDEIVTDVKELKQIEKKRQFGYRNSLSPEETDLLFRFAGTTDPTEALKDQDFKDLLEARRKRARVANAIPSSSNRSTSVEGKTFKEMTSEERAKNWSKVVPQ